MPFWFKHNPNAEENISDKGAFYSRSCPTNGIGRFSMPTITASARSMAGSMINKRNGHWPVVDCFLITRLDLTRWGLMGPPRNIRHALRMSCPGQKQSNNLHWCASSRAEMSFHLRLHGQRHRSPGCVGRGLILPSKTFFHKGSSVYGAWVPGTEIGARY